MKYHPHLSFPGYGWLEPFSDADMPLIEEEFARDIIAAFDEQNTQILLLTDALQIAVRQNSHDMLMTGDELRLCEAALEEST